MKCKIVFLNKNINGKYILTQDMICKANTIYLIKYRFDLQGKTIEFPKNCKLVFKGGCIFNGIVKGRVTNQKINPDFFDAKGNGISDDYQAIQNCFNIGKTIKFSKPKLYYISKPLIINNPFTIIQGNGACLKIKSYSGKGLLAISSSHIKITNIQITSTNEWIERLTEDLNDKYWKLRKIYNNYGISIETGSKNVEISKCTIYNTAILR